MKWWGTILYIIIALVVGCGGEAPKPTKMAIPPVEKKAVAPATTPTSTPAPILASPATQAKAEISPAETYTYNPKGKPDPFKPLIVEKIEAAPLSTKKSTEEVSADAPPLERMELGELKLVALVWNIGEPRAMVEDTGGKGYIVSLGTAIGKNKGKVTQINSKGIVVRERSFNTSSGKYKTQDVPLTLYVD